MPKNDLVRLGHMLGAVRDLIAITRGKSREDLIEDPVLTPACAWLLAVLGEAANQVTSETRDASPGMPWTEMRGMRNHLIHAYYDINPTVLWAAALDEVPPLIPLIERLIKELEAQG